MTMKTRLDRLEEKLMPNKFFIVWMCEGESKEAAIERYEADTGRTVRPGEAQFMCWEPVHALPDIVLPKPMEESL